MRCSRASSTASPTASSSVTSSYGRTRSVRDAQQVNKNLLLSGAAEVDTQPKLEIFADDVKCTHGAAVGRLDPQSLYYVKSRGLGEREARQLLVHGFINEVVGAIADDAVRQFADGVIAGQIDD